MPFREGSDILTALIETRDLVKTNSAEVRRPTELMRSFIDRGRSTAGAVQKNEVDILVGGKSGIQKRAKKASPK